MYTNSRDEEVKLIKALISEQEVLCPVCKGSVLKFFHKKAKKSNTDYICKSCGERFKVIDMMKNLD